MEFFLDNNLQDLIRIELDKDKEKEKKKREEAAKLQEETLKQTQADLETAFELSEEDKFVQSFLNDQKYNELEKTTMKLIYNSKGFQEAQKYKNYIDADEEVLDRITNRKDLREIAESRQKAEETWGDNGKLAPFMPKWERKLALGAHNLGSWIREAFNMDPDALLNDRSAYDSALHEFYKKKRLEYETDVLDEIQKQTLNNIDILRKKEISYQDIKHEYASKALERHPNIVQPFSPLTNTEKSTLRNYYKTNKIIDTYKNNGNRRGIENWASGFSTELENLITFGISDIETVVTAVTIESKLRKDMPLTPEERNFIESQTVLDNVTSLSAGKLGQGFSIGQQSAISIGLMSQMALGGGGMGFVERAGGKIALKGTLTKGTQYLAKREATSTFGKAISQGAKWIDDLTESGYYLNSAISASSKISNPVARGVVTGAHFLGSNIARGADNAISTALLMPMSYSSAGERFVGGWMPIEDAKGGTILTTQGQAMKYLETARDAISAELSDIEALQQALYVMNFSNNLKNNPNAEGQTFGSFLPNGTNVLDLARSIITRSGGSLSGGLTEDIILNMIKQKTETINQYKQNMDKIGDPTNPENPLHDVGWGKSLLYGWWKSANEVASEQLFGMSMERLASRLGGKLLGNLYYNSAKSFKAMTPMEKVIYAPHKAFTATKELLDNIPMTSAMLQNPWVEVLEEYEANLIKNPFGTSKEYRDGLLQLKDPDFFYTTLYTTLLIGGLGLPVHVTKAAISDISEGRSFFQSFSDRAYGSHLNTMLKKLDAYSRAVRDGRADIRDLDNTVASMLRPNGHKGVFSYEAVQRALKNIDNKDASDVINQIGMITYMIDQMGSSDEIKDQLMRALASEADKQGLQSIKDLDSYKSLYQHLFTLADEIGKINERANKKPEEGGFLSEAHQTAARVSLLHSYTYKVLKNNLTAEVERLITSHLVNRDDITPEKIEEIRTKLENPNLSSKDLKDLLKEYQISGEVEKEFIAFHNNAVYILASEARNRGSYEELMDEANNPIIESKIKEIRRERIRNKIIESPNEINDEFFKQLEEQYGITFSKEEIDDIKREHFLQPKSTSFEKQSRLKKLGLSHKQALEMAEKLNKQPKNSNKPILFVTGEKYKQGNRYYTLDLNGELLEVTPKFARKNSKKFQRINISANEQRDAIYKFLYDTISKNQDNSDKLGKPATQEWKELVKNAVRNHKMWNASIVSFFNAFYDEIAMSEGMDPNELADALKEIGMELQAEGTIKDYNEKLINDAKNELMAKLFYNPLKHTSQAAATNAVMIADQAAEKTEKTIIESIVDKGKIDGKVNLLKQGVALTLNFASTQFDVDDNGIYHNTNELTEDGKIVLKFNTFTPGTEITVQISDNWKNPNYMVRYRGEKGKTKEKKFSEYVAEQGYKDGIGENTTLEDIENYLKQHFDAKEAIERFQNIIDVLPIDVIDNNDNKIENAIQNVHDINKQTISDFRGQVLSDVASELNLSQQQKEDLKKAYETYLLSPVKDKEQAEEIFAKKYKEITGGDLEYVWNRANIRQENTIILNQYHVRQIRKQLYYSNDHSIKAKIKNKKRGGANFKKSEKHVPISQAIPTGRLGYIINEDGEIGTGRGTSKKPEKLLNKDKNTVKLTTSKGQYEPGLTVVYYEDPLEDDGYGFILPSTNNQDLLDKGVLCVADLLRAHKGNGREITKDEVKAVFKKHYNMDLSDEQASTIAGKLGKQYNVNLYPEFNTKEKMYKWSFVNNGRTIARISENGEVEEIPYITSMMSSLGTKVTFVNVNTDEKPMWTRHAHPEVDIKFEGYQLDEIPKRVTEPSISPVNNAVNPPIKQETSVKENVEQTSNEVGATVEKSSEESKEEKSMADQMREEQESIRLKLRRTSATLNHIFSKAFSKIDLANTDVINTKTIYDGAKDAYDELLNSLKENNEDNRYDGLIQFLEDKDNRDKILGLNGYYMNSVREMIDNFLLVNTKERDRYHGEDQDENTDLDVNDNMSFDKESFEKDVRLSMSTKCRIFFTGIEKVDNPNAIDGIQEYESPDYMYYAMKEAFYNSRTNNFEDLQDYIEKKVDGTTAKMALRDMTAYEIRSKYTFYQEILDKLKALRESENDQLYHEITYVLNTNKVVMNFIAIKNGVVKDFDANSKTAYNVKRKEVFDMWKISSILKSNEKGEYFYDKEEVDKLHLSDLINRLTIAFKQGVSNSIEANNLITDTLNALSALGFSASDVTIANLLAHRDAPIKDLKFSFSLSDLIRLFTNVKNTLYGVDIINKYGKQRHETGIFELNDITFNITSLDDVLLYQDNHTLFRNLILCEIFHSFIPTLPMYVAGKTINSFEQNRAYHIILKNFKNDISGYNDPENFFQVPEKIMDKYERTNFVKELYESGLIDALLLDQNLDVMEISQTSLQAIKFLDDKNREHMSFTELKPADRLATLFGYLTQQRIDVAEGTNAAFDNHAMKWVKMAFPAVSDAKILPLFTTLGFDLHEVINSRKGMDSIYKKLFEFAVMSEVRRIIDYYHKVANKNNELNIADLDNGSKIIVNNPFLNTIPFDFEKEENGKKESEKVCIINAIQYIAKNTDSEDKALELIKLKQYNGKTIYDSLLENYKDYLQSEIDFYFKKENDTYSGKIFDYGLASSQTSIKNNKRTTRLKNSGLIDQRYLDQFSTFTNEKGETVKVNEKEALENGLKCLATEFVINTHFSQAQIAMIFYGDPANYVDNKGIDVEQIDPSSKGISKFNKALAEATQTNLSKRLKELISPGNTLSNSENRQTTQIMLSDTYSSSESLKYLISLHHGPDALNDPKVNDYINRLQSDDIDEVKSARDHLKELFPDLKDYLKIERTNAEEYVTWKNYLNQLKYQGRVSKKMYESLTKKLEGQDKELRETGEIAKDSENRLTGEELKIIFQPSKPLYSGLKYEDVFGYKFQRYVYIKTASFPLLPELTSQFEDMEAVRRNMEQYEKDTDTDVRVSYNSGNKVGYINDAMSFKDLTKNYDDINQNGVIEYGIKSKIQASSILLDNSFFTIQQDKLYKMDRHIEEGVPDKINMMTQFEKIILANGINKIESQVFQMPEDMKDYLNAMGITDIKFDDHNRINGIDLYKIYVQLYKDKQKIYSEKLKEELEVSNDLDIHNADSYYRISKILQLKLTNQQDLEGIQVIYYYRNDAGKLVGASKEEIDKDKRKAEKVEKFDFQFPIWMLPNSRKFESLLNSIINNNSVRLKLPGSSGILASEEGFELRFKFEKGQVIRENAYKGDIIFTREFAERAEKDGRAKLRHDAENGISEVFMSSKFRDKDGKLIDITKYVDEDGYLDDERFPEELRTLFSARIPTSGHQSGIVIKIVGFLPHNVGDLMIVSEDATVQLGEDYDIDTRYYYMYNIEEYTKLIEKTFTNKNGEKVTKTVNQKYLGRVTGNLSDINANKINILDHLKSIQAIKSLHSYFRDTIIASKDQEIFDKYSTVELLTIFDKYNISTEFDPDKKEEIENSLREELQTLIIKELQKDNNKYTEDDINEHMDILLNVYDNYIYYDNEEIKDQIKKEINYRRLRDTDLLILENMNIDIYKSVFLSKHEDVKRKISKALSTARADISSRKIWDLISTGDTRSFYSPIYQEDMIRKGSDGKTGVSFYSAYLTANGLMQQVYKDLMFGIIKEGKLIPSNKMFFGNIVCQPRLGAEKTVSGAFLTDLFMELQNVALDNQKLQIMGRVNMNSYTIGVYAMMSLFGIDQETNLSDDLKDFDYAQLFMSQPIIRDYVDLMSKEEAYINRKKSANRADRRNKIITELKKKYKLTPNEAKIYNEEGYIKDGNLFKNLTTKNLVDALTNETPNNVLQHLVLSHFVKLQGYQEDFSKLQKFLNIEASGLGVSFFDTLDRRDFLLNILPQLKITNVEDLIGQYRRFNSTKPLTDKDKEWIQNNNAIYIGIDNYNNSVYINPTTPSGVKIVNSVMNGVNLWNQIFPFDHPNIKSQIDRIFKIYNIEDDDPYATETKYDILSSMKDYLYAGTSTIINAPNYIRYSLFKDTQDNDSLAKYIAKMKAGGNVIAQSIFFSLLDLDVEVTPDAVSTLRFNVANDNHFDRAMMSTILLMIMDSNEIIRDRNNQPIKRRINGRDSFYRYKDLAEDLFKYSLLAGNQEDGVGFRKYLPLEYFKKFGTVENIRSISDFTKTNSVQSNILQSKISHLEKIGLYYDKDSNTLISNDGKLNNDMINKIDEINNELGFEAFTYNVSDPNNQFVSVNMNYLSDDLFVIQYVQHNSEALPTLENFNPVNSSQEVMTTVNVEEKGDTIYPDYIRYDYNREISDEEGTTYVITEPLIYMRDKYSPGVVYKYISKLGAFGLNEYNPHQMQNQSLIDNQLPLKNTIIINNKSSLGEFYPGSKSFYEKIKNDMRSDPKKDLRYVLNQIVTSKNKYSDLASLIYSTGVNVDIEFSNELPTSEDAYYDKSLDKIVVLNLTNNDQFNDEKFVKTILHETIHAITYNSMKNNCDVGLKYEDGSIKLDATLRSNNVPIGIRKMIRVYKATLEELQKKNETDSEQVTEYKNKVVSNLRDFIDGKINQESLDIDTYELSDVHEMIVGALFNDKILRNILDNTTFKESDTSIWKKFKDSVIHIFKSLFKGSQENSLTEHLFDAFNSILEYYSKPAADKTVFVKNVEDLLGTPMSFSNDSYNENSLKEIIEKYC